VGTDGEERAMGISWRKQDQSRAAAEATSRWNEAAMSVAERFQHLNELPLEDAVEVALMRAPGNMSREELTRRIAASREGEPPRE
jgi:hypothetical protein